DYCCSYFGLRGNKIKLMNILEIYKKYQIMPQLAEHQLRVAAVASLICENFQGDIDMQNIVTACLLHDMGNIVKFNFDTETLKKLHGVVSPEQAKQWEQVKQEFLAKYGGGSHNVTMKIVDELGVGERIRELVDCVGFNQAKENEASPD